MDLSPEELRVLGALIEKGATTPDQYPLTTNALVAACNQKTSREPVVAYDERTVLDTMLLLRPAGLARTIVSGRTDKHRHVLDEALHLDAEELAVLAVLMLRGPQAPGELKTRTDRYVSFDDLTDVEVCLRRLAERDEPLVTNLGRGPGQSQDRWAHLLGDEEPVLLSAAPPRAPIERAPSRTAELEARVDALEARLAALEVALGVDTAPSTGDAASGETDPAGQGTWR